MCTGLKDKSEHIIYAQIEEFYAILCYMVLFYTLLSGTDFPLRHLLYAHYKSGTDCIQVNSIDKFRPFKI